MPVICRLPQKSSGSVVLTGTAIESDVASGKTFYNTDSNTKLTGTASGGTSDEWAPNSTWWDIKSILQDDSRSYLGKWICLINDSDVSTVLTVNTNIVAYATSDGAFYTTTTTHTWDTSKDKDCNEGYKTRYIIYYSNLATTPVNTSVGSTFAYINSLYIVLDTNISYGANFLQSFPMIQSFDFINSKNFNTITMSQLCYQCYSLKRLPNNINTVNVTNFSNFCNQCYSLRILPFIDTSKATVLTSFCQNCTTLMCCLGEISFASLTATPSNFLNNCTLLTIINITHIKYSFDMASFVNLNHMSLLNIVNGLNDLTGQTLQTLKIGVNLISKLSIAERTIAINKNWNIA